MRNNANEMMTQKLTGNCILLYLQHSLLTTVRMIFCNSTSVLSCKSTFQISNTLLILFRVCFKSRKLHKKFLKLRMMRFNTKSSLIRRKRRYRIGIHLKMHIRLMHLTNKWSKSGNEKSRSSLMSSLNRTKKKCCSRNWWLKRLVWKRVSIQ